MLAVSRESTGESKGESTGVDRRVCGRIDRRVKWETKKKRDEDKERGHLRLHKPSFQTKKKENTAGISSRLLFLLHSRPLHSFLDLLPFLFLPSLPDIDHVLILP